LFDLVKQLKIYSTRKGSDTVQEIVLALFDLVKQLKIYSTRKGSDAVQEIVKQLSWECNISQFEGDIIEPYFLANSLFFKKFLVFRIRESISYWRPFWFSNANDIFRY